MSREAEVWRQAHEAICQHLREKFRLSEGHASEYASEVLDALSAEFGGQRLYINKAAGKPQVSGAQLRRELLEEKARPKDQQEKYGLSRSQYYRLLEEGKDDA